MRIPHIFNGRNKLFFFFSFDGFDDRKPTENTFNHTVPTSQNRVGDFSDLLRINGTKYQIYDPLTVRPDRRVQDITYEIPCPATSCR